LSFVVEVKQGHKVFSFETIKNWLIDNEPVMAVCCGGIEIKGPQLFEVTSGEDNDFPVLERNFRLKIE
jgi:hypothetical protein